jgi:peptidoglycan/LPS O-acetylase OafA/YrhL
MTALVAGDVADAHEARSPEMLASEAPALTWTPTRLAYVDGVRALAALYVVVTHAWRMVWPDHSGRVPAGVLSPLTAWLAYGHFAVSVFIVVSGFSLMLAVVRADGRLAGGAWGFFKRRCRRILPTHYAALALSLTLIALLIGRKTGTIWDVSLPVNPAVALIHVLMLQDLVVPYSVNYAFWSIAVEFHIYFLFPLLVWLWRRVGPWWTVAGAVALSAVLYLELVNTILNSLNPQYVGLFALGMLAAQIGTGREKQWQRLRERVSWRHIALAAVVMLSMACLIGGGRLLDHLTYLDGLAGLAAAATLVAAARPVLGRLRATLEWRPLVLLGLFSYSVYLIHAPLLQVLWQYVLYPLHLGDTVTFFLLELGGVPLILAAAYGFFLVFERPFLRHSGRAAGQSGASECTGRSVPIHPAPAS